ncbi:hypothetical protein FHS00_002609 [Limimaricola variabilis]|uniref:Uncharacterized protein n=1 Tax=Limimaricola variabilis TaxID=1492771 RepID=A0ABR6HRF4_9RHOB|nr:hypothetical protein [Limimaricola variabilis]MBB3713008.1 hypothetical protein [Limimaricola variabilis]
MPTSNFYIFPDFLSAKAVFLALAALTISASSLSAEEERRSINALLYLYDSASDACKKEEDIDADTCRKTWRIERALEERGVCRVPGPESKFLLCANYRHHQVFPQMKEYNFGFSRIGGGKKFSTRFASFEATRDGDVDRRDIGSINILCNDEGAAVWFEIDGDHPSFLSREEETNLVGMVDGSGKREFFSGFYERRDQQGVFGFTGEVAGPRILKYFLESLEISAPKEDLKIVLWPADKNESFAKLELDIGTVFTGNIELMEYSQEIRTLLSGMLETCQPH